MSILIDEKPPLDLGVELSAPDGSTTWRWTADKTRPEDRPLSLNFKTARFQGFADGGCVLRRNPGTTWPDLRLLSQARFIGAGDFTAYEGRLTGRPGGTDGGRSITVAANGWMDHAKDRKFSMVFIDRDPAAWSAPSTGRQNALSGAGWGTPGDVRVTTDGAGNAGLQTVMTGAWAAKATAEAWYDAGPFVAIASLRSDWFEGAHLATSDASWNWFLALADDDAGASQQVVSLDTTAFTAGSGEIDASSTARRYAALLLEYGIAGGTDGFEYAMNWVPRVIGNHGLSIVGSDAATEGVLASDVIRWIVQHFCPMLNADGVQDTTTPLPQLAFKDRTFPYDAFLTCNQPHLYGLEVWEKRTVWFQPVVLDDWDWQIRLSDYGVTANWTGESIDNVVSGVEVQYTDVDTGQQATLLPADHAELRDDSPSNIWNAAGYPGEKSITLSSPCSQAYALQVGQTALQEFNRPRSPGQIKVDGHIRDRAGNWQPVWKVRAGQRILIRDDADAMPLLIVETDYQHDQRELSMSVDSTFKTIDAVLAQQGASTS